MERFSGYTVHPYSTEQLDSTVLEVRLLGDQIAYVWTLLDQAALNELVGVTKSRFPDPMYVKPALAKYGLLEIQRRVRAGTFPTRRIGNPIEIRINQDEFPEFWRLYGEKRCNWQRPSAAGLVCAADVREVRDDPVMKRSVPPTRSEAPTTPLICAACNVPDSSFLCSHFHHPAIVGWQSEHGWKRSVYHALCERGFDERIRKTPASCSPANGHECWEYRILTEAEPEVRSVSPGTLHEALDFLDSTWRLAFGKEHRLISPPTFSSSQSLAEGCRSRDEFDSRMSALADTLKRIRVDDSLLPEGKRTIPMDRSFERLEACLQENLSSDDMASVSSAVAKLRRVNATRAKQQHSGRPHEMMKNFEALGLPFPPADWGATWNHVRALTAEAIAEIRVQVQKIDRG